MKRITKILAIFLVLAILIPRIPNNFKIFIRDEGKKIFDEVTNVIEYPENKDTKEPTSSEVSEIEEEVVRFTNINREENGLLPLVLDEKLSKVAKIKSEDMDKEDYFDHVSPIYGSPFDMMNKFGINYMEAGENIAMGYISAESVVDGWMNSKGHRENILNSNFNRIGIGAHKDKIGRIYWTQMFRN